MTSDHDIFCEVTGDGFPVVMIHGLGGAADTFEPLVAGLAGFRVIRPELPGSGRSALSMRAFSIDFFAEAVLARLRALGVRRAHFVGHSLGTLVCQQIAVSEPASVESLALIGALTELPQAARTALADRARRARAEGMTDVAADVADFGVSARTKADDPNALGFVRASIGRQDPEGYARTCEALSTARAIDCRQIAVPTLLLTGTEDRVAPPAMAEALAAVIRGARLTLLEGSGHWPTIERPWETSQALVEFLGGQPTHAGAAPPPSAPAPTHQEMTMTNGSITPGWNDTGSGSTVFTNVRILDATGEPPFPGEVWVQGNRIREIRRTNPGYGTSNGTLPSASNGANMVDGSGATLMPGLIDAHLHLSWNNAPGIDPIQMMETEEHMLVTMEMAKLVLDAGFTAGRGAAAAKPRLDVVCRNFINEGRFPGPRYLAAGPEITTVGGLGDAAPSHIPHEGLNLGWVVSGPEEVRRAVRQLIKYGVDSIKLNLSGEAITGMGAEETPMSDEEVQMAVSEARRRGKVLSAHARSSGSVKQCVRFGIENIYHASFADEEALTMLERAKDRHFVAPGIAWLINTARYAEEYGIKPGSAISMEYERELEMCIDTMKKMHRRGIRVLIGGDYGFAWTPQGTNAKDIETFVDMLGFTPMEAIQAGTKLGGEIMGMGSELGQVREGFLADLLLVDGDPIADVRILQDCNRLLAIMKDGAFYKPPAPRAQGYAAVPASM